MFYVYLLRNTEGKVYIGYSSDLRRRIAEHLKNKVYTTRRLGKNFKLIYYEAYINELSAKIRERKLKQYGSAYQGLVKRLNIGA